MSWCVNFLFSYQHFWQSDQNWSHFPSKPTSSWAAGPGSTARQQRETFLSHFTGNSTINLFPGKKRQQLGTLPIMKFWIFEIFEILKFWNFYFLNAILGTCLATFVFMSRLKSRCLKLKMSMLFFGHQQQQQPHPVSLEFIELVPS